MPDDNFVFSKDGKLQIIEYGTNRYKDHSWNDIKTHVMTFNPVSLFHGFTKH